MTVTSVWIPCWVPPPLRAPSTLAHRQLSAVAGRGRGQVQSMVASLSAEAKEGRARAVNDANGKAGSTQQQQTADGRSLGGRKKRRAGAGGRGTGCDTGRTQKVRAGHGTTATDLTCPTPGRTAVIECYYVNCPTL